MKVREKIDAIRASVEGCPSSIFTRADVLALLSSLSECEERDPTPKALPWAEYDVLRRSLIRAQEAVQNVDVSRCDVGLYLDGNEIVFDHIRLDEADEVCEDIARALRSLEAVFATNSSD